MACALQARPCSSLPLPLCRAGSWDSVETYLLLIYALICGATIFTLMFGTWHCILLLIDLTTKELIVDWPSVRDNPPCCPGARSPAALLRSYGRLFCGPMRLRTL